MLSNLTFFPLHTKVHTIVFVLVMEGRKQKRGFVPPKTLCMPGILICNKVPFIFFQHSERTLTCYPIKKLLCCQKKCKNVEVRDSTLIYNTMEKRKWYVLGTPKFSRAKRLSSDRVDEW